MLRLFSSRIQQAKVTLTHNETELLRSLSAQAGVIPRATITELAQSVFSSPSTIHRLIRKLGFKGYTDFKVRVEDSLESELPLVLAQPNLLKITISSIEHTFRLNQGVPIWVAGTAMDGETISLPGVWAAAPLVAVTALSLPQIQAGEQAESPARVGVADLREVEDEGGEGTGQWEFDAAGDFEWVAIGYAQ